MTDQPEYQQGVDKRYVRPEDMQSSDKLMDRIGRASAERTSNFHLGRVLLAGVTGGLAVGGVLWTLNSTLVEQDRIAAAPPVDLTSFRQQIKTNGLSVTFQHKGRAVSPKYVELTGFATFLSKKEEFSTNTHRNFISRVYSFDSQPPSPSEDGTNAPSAVSSNSFNLFLVTRTDPIRPEIEDPALTESGTRKVSAVIGLKPRICSLTATSAVMYPVIVRAAE